MGSPLGSEDNILACIDRHFPTAHPHLLLGRGDDCCVLADSGPLCVSTDLFMEDVHFRRSYFTPQEIGYKALAVNLSDLAACGSRPLGFSAGLALPPDADAELVDALFGGMAQAAAPPGACFNAALSGGDLSRAEKLHLCITVFGDTPDAGALKRGGLHPGDRLFVIGEPGLAGVGLARLEAEGRAALRHFPAACAAHLRPRPLVAEGLRLAALARAGSGKRPRLALMDVSDGLARDLPRLLGSPALGADLRLPPPHPEVLRQARETCGALPAEDKAEELMLLGGEDYALLGACAPGLETVLASALPEAVFIGRVSDRPGVRCSGRPVSGGFDHFG